METTNEMPVMGIVQNHLEAKHGKIKAAQKLKTMSESDLIQILDTIAEKRGKENTNIMPVMEFSKEDY